MHLQAASDITSTVNEEKAVTYRTYPEAQFADLSGRGGALLHRRGDIEDTALLEPNQPRYAEVVLAQ